MPTTITKSGNVITVDDGVSPVDYLAQEAKVITLSATQFAIVDITSNLAVNTLTTADITIPRKTDAWTTSVLVSYLNNYFFTGSYEVDGDSRSIFREAYDIDATEFTALSIRLAAASQLVKIQIDSYAVSVSTTGGFHAGIVKNGTLNNPDFQPWPGNPDIEVDIQSVSQTDGILKHGVTSAPELSTGYVNVQSSNIFLGRNAQKDSDTITLLTKKIDVGLEETATAILNIRQFSE